MIVTAGASTVTAGVSFGVGVDAGELDEGVGAGVTGRGTG